ncbi:MAG: type II toxin-antitoxin system VapC family toxin [Acidobacteriota bacterium]
MLNPASGPFLFDTSAEGWFKRSDAAASKQWLDSYLRHHPMHIASMTVFERVRGYAVLWRSATPDRKAWIEAARIAYLQDPGHVWPVDTGIAVIAGEISAMLPHPPTTVKRTHRMTESRQERLARWRVDIVIAATSLASGMLLLHNNAADFEAIRGAVEREPLRFPKLGPLQLMRCASAIS